MKLEDSPFDSQHYELRIGRLIPEPSDGVAGLGSALDEARRRFDVVFLRIADTDPLRDTLRERGQAAIDTLVSSTLGAIRRRVEPRTDLAIEHHDRLHDADVVVVAAITAASITTSHLHADPRLPIARTRQLYAAWARNDVTGRAQRVIVARAGTELVGYTSVIVRPGSALIDLVAVAPGWQGKGVGSAMLASFIDWVGERKLVATVGTQATNPALQLYARHGFTPTETHLTYHLWST